MPSEGNMRCVLHPSSQFLRNGKAVALNTQMQQVGSGEVFLNCTLNVRVSNLCWDTGYSDRRFRRFLQLLRATAWTVTLDRTVCISEEREEVQF